jgi:hypothetical protein
MPVKCTHPNGHKNKMGTLTTHGSENYTFTRPRKMGAFARRRNGMGKKTPSPKQSLRKTAAAKAGVEIR